MMGLKGRELLGDSVYRRSTAFVIVCSVVLLGDRLVMDTGVDVWTHAVDGSTACRAGLTICHPNGSKADLPTAAPALNIEDRGSVSPAVPSEGTAI